MAVQKARGSPVARRITKTLVLLVGDTGDRLLLEDWCRRFRTPLKPWVGFTFVQSTDFDANHFHPDYRTRQQIVWKMSGDVSRMSWVCFGQEKKRGRTE